MVSLLVAAASLNQTPLDWDGNRRRILDAISQAQAAKVRFLCLPELCLTGYGCEDMFLANHVHARAIGVLESIIPKTAGLMVNVGLPVEHGGAVYNCAAVIKDRVLLGFTAKKHLCGDGVHYEPRWFNEWPEGKTDTILVDGKPIPFGDIIYEIDGVNVGFEICQDAWVKPRHAVDLAARGVSLIANPSASHFAFHKRQVVEQLCAEGSRICRGTYIFANLLGCESGRTIYGGDRIIFSNGKLVACGERFTYRDVELTTVTVPCDQGISRPSPETVKLMGTDVLRQKLEDFARAVALGLFDYMRKSRSRGFVVSLSGGADSTAASCLVHLMYHFAIRDLGAQGLQEKLKYFTGLDATSPEHAMQQLLCCVYQRTENSSTTTEKAAFAVATAIGATFYDISIDELVRAYRDLVGHATGHNFSWEKDDLVLQNIQARVRSPSVWMLANYRGSLLLTTSNRSEAAVGYATMDGDTSGGLSPLGGIDKAFLRRWLLWLQTEGPKETGPMAALSFVTAQSPTAELRPLSAKQTDEADLMPYDVLDVVERLAVRDKQSPLGVWNAVTEIFKGRFTKEDLGRWVERFFTLWSVSQWKRERYAPSFHIDDESLDPKTWCRFPILSGGFALELEELRTLIAKS